MSNKDLKLALELAAKATGREEIAALNKEVGNLGPISNEVEQETQALAQRLQQLGQQRDQIDAFNKSKEALTQLELATVLSRDKLESLRKVQASGAGDAEQLAKQEKLLASEVKQLESQLVRQAATHTKLGAGLKQSGIDTRNLGTEQNRLQREITETANRTEKLAKELIGAKESSSGFGASIGGLTTRLVAMASAYVGIQALKDTVLSFFEAGDKAEQLSIQMNAVMGSISGGKEATVWINDFAKKTPLQLNEVTQTFIRLKAMGLDPMDGTMQAVVDQSAKLGLGFEGVEGVSLALGQAWAKGKLQGEEMLQMQERGVPVQALLAQALGKTSTEITNMSAKGLLGRDAIKALIAEMGGESAGAANAQMGTMSGLMSNLGDSWTNFKVAVANSGALEWLKLQLTELNNTINEMAADGRLKQYAKQVSDWLVSTGQSVKQFMLEIGGSFDGLLSSVNVTVQSLRLVFNVFTAAVKGMAAGFLTNLFLITASLEKLARALGMDGLAAELGQATDLMKAEMKAFAKSAEEDLNDIADAANRMSGAHTKAKDEVKKSLQEAEDKSKESAAGIVDAQNQIKNSSAGTASSVSEAFAKAGLDLEQASGRVSETVKGFVDGLRTIAESADVNGQATQAFLAKAFNSAHNIAEIKALTTEMQALHAQGKLVGAPYIESLDLATAAAKKLSATSAEGAALYIQALKAQKAAVEEAFKAGQISADVARQKVGQLNLELQKTEAAATKNVHASNDLENAYTQLGMKGSAALEAIAAKQRAALDVIQMSGASLAQQQQAFLAYAKAELEAAQASGRYADGALAAKAASLGLSKELDALITSTETVGSQALITAGALDTMAGSASKAGDASAEAAAKTHAMTAAAEGAGAASSYISNYTASLESSLRQLSPQAEAMMKATMGWTSATRDASSAMADLDQKLAANYANWKRINDSITLDDIQGHIKDIGLAYLSAERAYLQQAQAAEQMREQLSSTNNVTAKTIRYAEELATSFDLLDEQDLSGLRSAIDSAKSKMDALNQSATSTVSNLRDELDQYAKNYDAIEQRRYETQISELNEKLRQASAARNQDAINDFQEAIRLADQLHQKKMQDIAAEKAETAKTQTTTTTPASSNSQQSTQAVETKRFEIVMGNKSAVVYADANNSAQLEKLISQLQQEAMRA